MKNAIKELKVEYYSLKEDIVLSWKYESEKKTYMQKSYRVYVYDGESNIFDTGVVKPDFRDTTP